MNMLKFDYDWITNIFYTKVTLVRCRFAPKIFGKKLRKNLRSGVLTGYVIVIVVGVLAIKFSKYIWRILIFSNSRKA